MKPVHQILTDEIDYFFRMVSEAYHYSGHITKLDIKDTNAFRRQYDKSKLALIALKDDLDNKPT